MARGKVGDLLKTAVQVCQGKASSKQIRLELTCDEDLEAFINPPLLEQAVVNLLDNAIKYSNPQSTVEMKATHENGETIISVQDEGIGIEQEHLPRLFERFYRVDKGRSRRRGGTGLGLAIVKHITQSHRGRVTVESTPGKGSTFRIHLPRS